MPKTDNTSATHTVLAVDCGGSALSVAVWQPQADFLQKIVEPQQRGGERLPFAVEELLAAANLKMADVSLLVFASGPGSFTGVRVAASFMEGLGQALSLPVVGVPTLPLFATQFSPAAVPIVVWNEAHGGMVYQQIFTPQGQPQGAAQALKATEALAALPQGALMCGDACSSYAEALQTSGKKLDLSQIYSPEARAAQPEHLLAAGYAQWQQGAEPKRPQLLYVKPLTYKKIDEQGPAA